MKAAKRKSAKRPQSKGCDCIEQVNKLLIPHNTRLVTRLLFNFDTGKYRTVLELETEKINPKIRKPRKTVCASHCPFCGKAIKSP